MFEKKYEKRLESWAKFREGLEEAEDPLREVVKFYKQAPFVSIHTNPWDRESWPDPWELIFENQYDDFCRVLGMCYSLQLTERFKGSDFEIHICTFSGLGYMYLLFIDDYVLGFDDEKPVLREKLPSDIRSQETYRMTKLQ